MASDPVIEQLIAGFTAEARDICQRITANILALEHAEDLAEVARKQHYEELARGLHTLKGNADTFGFSNLAELAHEMEDVVAKYRPSLATLPPDATDLLLRSIDVFVARLVARDDTKPPVLEQQLEQASERPAERPAERATDDWRIGPRNVEMLMREVERLRELRLKLDEHKREIDRGLHALERGVDPADVRALLVSLSRSLASNSEEANDIVDGLEQELKAIATLPMYTVLDPLQRAVRDLCRTLGKEARLAIVGAEISIDRRLLEALKGPLVHLVRNAVDHGIETPQQRTAAGKHREGAITIRVERAGNLVTIEVDDDGGGMDPTAIRDTAIARGVISAEDTPSDKDLHQLVFRPGFSTRTAVSETSGRGVGLDAVRAAVQALAGHVELHTTRGSGSRFVISVPATLGATPVLVVRVDEQLFGVPMIAIETIRAAKPEHVRIGHSTARFEHDGRLIPLIDLGAVLALRSAALPTDARPILIIASHGQKIALSVDELIGDRELVVRPLPVEIHDLPSYQGAAVQARGDLLLVLQPEFLVSGQVAAAAPTEAVRRALVVDDSLTARALHRTILESGGYQVHTVGGARQALDHLRHAHYDVVIADVMMPDIDGLQMTSMLRERRETRDVPIILVSAHDAQPERERGLAAGADSFVSKKDCISGRLLGEIATVIARRSPR